MAQPRNRNQFLIDQYYWVKRINWIVAIDKFDHKAQQHNAGFLQHTNKNARLLSALMDADPFAPGEGRSEGLLLSLGGIWSQFWFTTNGRGYHVPHLN